MSVIDKIKRVFEGPDPLMHGYTCRKCQEPFEVPEDEPVECPHCGAEGGIAKNPPAPSA